MSKRFKAIVRDKRGLTLIELLAVMAILAILAAIIVPSVAGQGEVGR
jgi:prepilin-type N-terminal cleavage/methylation domain-containing protein